MSVELGMPSNHLILCRPLLLLPSIFPASEFFPMNQLFASGGQSVGASASVLPMNIQDLFPLGWTGWISLQSKGLSRVFFNTGAQPSLWSSSHPVHDYWKNHSFDYVGLCWQSNVSVFNTLSRFVIAFLPRSKRLLISWLQSPSAVILEPPKNKICHCFHCFPIYLP